MLTVVAGSWGAGKTHWISSQLLARANASKPALYIAPATVGVDAYRLKIEMPQIQIETALPAALTLADQSTIWWVSSLIRGRSQPPYVTVVYLMPCWPPIRPC